MRVLACALALVLLLAPAQAQNETDSTEVLPDDNVESTWTPQIVTAAALLVSVLVFGVIAMRK